MVFLLWACLIWVLPDSRKWCLRMSPLFTIYGGVLLILQYITGFKISFDQFHWAYERRTMEQIGIRINDYFPAFVPLLVKVRYYKTNRIIIQFALYFFFQSFYMILFWLTFRQFINERRNFGSQSTEG